MVKKVTPNADLMDLPITRAELWDLLHDLRMAVLSVETMALDIVNEDNEEFDKDNKEARKYLADLTFKMNAMIGLSDE